jgi:hypothetical protein
MIIVFHVGEHFFLLEIVGVRVDLLYLAEIDRREIFLRYVLDRCFELVKCANLLSVVHELHDRVGTLSVSCDETMLIFRRRV